MNGFLLFLLTAGLAAASDAPPTPFWSDPKVFRCSPATVGPGETLLLFKQHPALRELAVRRVGSKATYVLVIDSPPEELTPLMSPEALADAKEVRIDVSQLSGIEWRVGARPEKVFTAPGTYEFLLSTTLESDEGAYTCRVKYRPAGKRAPQKRAPAR